MTRKRRKNPFLHDCVLERIEFFFFAFLFFIKRIFTKHEMARALQAENKAQRLSGKTMRLRNFPGQVAPSLE